MARTMFQKIWSRHVVAEGPGDERPGSTLTVDLESQTITGPSGDAIRFEIDAFRKHGLLTGQDELEMTLARLPAIEAFEARHRGEMPWLG